MEPIRLAVNGRTDVGRVREANEDSIRCHTDPDHPFAYVIVADGMGGYSGGATASKIAADTLQHHLDSQLDSAFFSCTPEQQQAALHTSLANAIHAANREILNAKSAHPQLAQMGTTLVLAVIWHDFLIVAHLGDSRAYLWNHYGLQRLTRDHSVVQEMIDSGQLTPEQAQESNIRNHITRALGVSDHVEPIINSWKLTENALLLLCSDGLTEYLDDRAIEQVLASHRPALDCVCRFVDDANRLGGRDNISAGVLEFTNRAEARAENLPDAITLRPKKEDITVRREQR
ncbi:Stp1/IreP family PP2C-type Ser/Thr phosphatase [Microbulbifer rhizosphaerae]|uniref:Protein phosphatase n=1 Tax=Microbulbifer rhizosphaerae TaxID=1562603 RepID=A0A7W4WB16_9GAMM|nr:Stp1/IreP family PP2C-type Ser/Thr phosphatase [Microbulbifer rhizosphaerae]MBB3060963.1 protein phosphatase [Microbulbifer rhizosphaerae]